ncbi:DNA polymerase-4 [Amnibacterium kyonggiense]|uniref:DNA polymerase IV n=2 Tax=Amnibacterium kyonggiense TaxID=595671 RepID=A0A4R7FT14_9MICO|nr:DNA polymerase IV [Amnibacterium kyonggiense]TDS81021.1 DNA polymerase-4 [Amnibacterium kyonggiense]
MTAKGGEGERQVSAADVDSSRATVLHVDMDAFFASVELLEHPELVHRPVIIGHEGGRGIVSSANYAARRFGIRSAMPVARAMRLCPQAVVLHPHYEKYRDASAEVMRIFHDVTPIVEPLSIDEAFLDVAGAVRLFGPPARIAANLRARVRRETGLTCSIGAGATKFIAKLASTRSKPDGLLVVPPERTLEFLHPLPIGAIWGVGPATRENLERRGIRTVRDLAETPRQVLEGWVGPAAGGKLHDLAWGRDARHVSTSRTDKSIGHENTFGTDISDLGALQRELLEQADRVAVRLRKGGWRARTVSLKVRFADFTTITRSRTLPEATDLARRIHEQTVELLDAADLRGRAVRLLGTRGEQLVRAEDELLGLWSDQEQWRGAETAADRAALRFGRGAVLPAALLERPVDRERLADSEG